MPLRLLLLLNLLWLIVILALKELHWYYNFVQIDTNFGPIDTYFGQIDINFVQINTDFVRTDTNFV